MGTSTVIFPGIFPPCKCVSRSIAPYFSMPSSISRYFRVWAMYVWTEHTKRTKLRTLALAVAKRRNVNNVNSFRSNIQLFLSLNIMRLD